MHTYKIGEHEFTLQDRKLTKQESHPHNIWKTLEKFNLFMENFYKEKQPNVSYIPVTQEQWESIENPELGMDVTVNPAALYKITEQ